MNRDHLLYAAAAVAVALALLAPFITAPSQGESLPMVYIIYEYGKGDLSYTDSAYRGLFAAQEALPFVKREFVSTEPTTITTLQNITGPERPGLVITIGDNFSDTTRQLAGENPDVLFLAIDQAGIGSENIQAY
ncbi:MAG: BMP family ABC transporter substrate-binding protein, partial [Methanomicrobiales archaeon]|nr:BMP family ABC transporter substrate-binding protein [Methanomicrobiales archaeon]